AAGTPMGSVASLNVNTNPEFAAPSVEKNPLLLTVTVGQPNDTGIMTTGGFGTKSRDAFNFRGESKSVGAGRSDLRSMTRAPGSISQMTRNFSPKPSSPTQLSSTRC